MTDAPPAEIADGYHPPMRGLAKLLFSVCVIGGLSGCLKAPPVAVDPTASTEATAAADGRVWAGVPVAAAYPPGEVRAFEFMQSGRRIGRSWGRYVGPDPSVAGAHVFETRIELELPGRDPLRSAGELVLDDQGHVVRGFERSVAAELTFQRKGDTLEVGDGKRVESFGYEPERIPSAVMAHSAVFHEELFLRIGDLSRGANERHLISLSGGIPAGWSADAHASGGAVVLETNLGETITLREGRIQAIEVTDSELKIATVPDGWPAWSIKGPQRLAYEPPAGAGFTLREVEIPGRAESPTLFGEVVLPRGAGAKPAVLWVGTSGREDRHGFAGPPPVDLGSHEITDALANAGFVVMRFDERGQGKSQAGALSFAGQVDDAKRALGMLLVQPEVDPDRVILVGHGEGGLRVLSLAATQKGGLVGVALLGSPGRPYREVFLEQAEAALEELPPELRAGAQAQQQKMVAAVESGGDVPPELEAEAAWLAEMFVQRPALLIARLAAPMFVAQGGKDFEVDPKKDVAALLRAARKAKLEPTVHRYPDLDHLFKPEPGESGPARYLVPNRHVDARFLEHLTSWALTVASAKP